MSFHRHFVITCMNHFSHLHQSIKKGTSITPLSINRHKSSHQRVWITKQKTSEHFRESSRRLSCHRLYKTSTRHRVTSGSNLWHRKGPRWMDVAGEDLRTYSLAPRHHAAWESDLINSHVAMSFMLPSASAVPIAETYFNWISGLCSINSAPFSPATLWGRNLLWLVKTASATK